MKKFTKDHEWVNVSEKPNVIGITTHAANALGDIVFVELPEVGMDVKKGDAIAVVESVKAASDIYSPMDGKIIDVNSELENNPGLINEDPMEKGWIFKLEIANEGDLDELLDDDAYNKHIS